jgi:hypothetical protein
MVKYQNLVAGTACAVVSKVACWSVLEFAGDRTRFVIVLIFLGELQISDFTIL